jgi:hypothetical protein
MSGIMGRQHQRRGTVGEKQHWQKKIVAHWEGLFGKIIILLQHRWLNWIFTLKTLFPQKLCDVSFINPTSTARLQLLNLRLLWLMLRCVNGVTTIKPWHQITRNAAVIWSDESSFTLFPTSGRIYVWRTPKEAYNPECLVPTVKHGWGCDDLGSNIMIFCWSHYYPSWLKYCKGVCGQVG